MARRKKTCSKIRYFTRESAVSAALSYQREFGTRRMNAYACDDCRHDGGQRYWHIGHSSRKYS